MLRHKIGFIVSSINWCIISKGLNLKYEYRNFASQHSSNSKQIFFRPQTSDIRLQTFLLSIVYSLWSAVYSLISCFEFFCKFCAKIYAINCISLLLLMGCGTLSSTIKQDAILQNNLGTKYINLGLWHDAKLHLLKALELSPQKASVYNNLGVVYEYFNQIKDAQKTYQKAVELEPQISLYKENLNLFENELLGTTTTAVQKTKKITSNIKISTNKIKIKRMVEPKLKLNKISRVAIFGFSKDEKAKEIGEKITGLFKISIVEESPFYILEDYEINELTQGEPVTQQDLSKTSKVSILNKILSTDGIFVINLNEFKDIRYKDFELKNYYSQEKQEFVYYNQPYIKRNVQVDISISFLEGTTGNLLWDKHYKDEMSTTYLGEDEGIIPLFDMQLFKDFINKSVSDFISDISPQEKVYERIVVMEE